MCYCNGMALLKHVRVCNSQHQLYKCIASSLLGNHSPCTCTCTCTWQVARSNSSTGLTLFRGHVSNCMRENCWQFGSCSAHLKEKWIFTGWEPLGRSCDGSKTGLSSSSQFLNLYDGCAPIRTSHTHMLSVSNDKQPESTHTLRA